MERIEPGRRSFYSPKNKEKKKVRTNEAKLSFSTIVDGETQEVDGGAVFAELGIEEGGTLEQMLDAIHSVGDRVRENASAETVSAYRRAVKSFMQYILQNALKVEVQSSSPNILRQKKFTVVKVIDQKLERLASGVLMNQYKTLEILARIDEINGLLVDLIS